MVNDRFQVCDPKLKELIETYPTRREAMKRAWREAAKRAYYIEVFDCMARFGEPQLWHVLTAGNIVLHAKRNGQVAVVLAPE